MPADGHVNPALPVAARLVERGHRVWWHTGAEYAARVRATGARCVPFAYTPRFEQLTPKANGQRGIAAANTAIKRLFVEPMLGQLRDYETILAEFPADVVLADLASGALLLHEKGGPPWATLGIGPLLLTGPDVPPFASGLPLGTTPFRRARNQALHWLGAHLALRDTTTAFNVHRSLVGLPPLPRGKTVFDTVISPYLHLQGTSAAFEYPRHRLPGQVHFVGPLLPPAAAAFTPPAWWGDLDDERPVVAVTQGTVATDAADLVLLTLRGLADADALVVAITPDPAALGPLPPNARVERFIPFAALLPRVDVLVTNGGYGGVQVALAHGVPLVAAGQTEDKPEVCARIAWAGVGIDLKTSTPTAEQVAGAVRAILADPGYRRNAQRIQKDFARYDGPTEAARLLERLAATRAPVTA
jgi:UDP:flavonoid glycosyltransferase YjiC (YdhE family)